MGVIKCPKLCYVIYGQPLICWVNIILVFEDNFLNLFQSVGSKKKILLNVFQLFRSLANSCLISFSFFSAELRRKPFSRQKSRIIYFWGKYILDKSIYSIRRKEAKKGTHFKNSENKFCPQKLDTLTVQYFNSVHNNTIH